MACNSPFQGYRRAGGEIGFHEQPGDVETLRLPCGRCTGCRLDRAADWTVRCLHEASLYSSNVYLTLTYADEFVPVDGSLEYRDVQLFLKKLRKKKVGDSFAPNGRRPIRFFCAGEYGEQFGRPHYHLLLFNVEFNEGKYRVGKQLFRSPLVDALWPMGDAKFGSVTARSVAYVSQYCMKKVYGRQASEEHYVDRKTGSIRRSEFVTMSRRPGIGTWWFEKFRSDLFPVDYVVVEGRKSRVPRFYSRKYEAEDQLAYELVKEAREEKLLEVDRSWERMEAREKITRARLRLFNERKL